MFHPSYIGRFENRHLCNRKVWKCFICNVEGMLPNILHEMLVSELMDLLEMAQFSAYSSEALCNRPLNMGVSRASRMLTFPDAVSTCRGMWKRSNFLLHKSESLENVTKNAPKQWSTGTPLPMNSAKSNINDDDENVKNEDVDDLSCYKSRSSSWSIDFFQHWSYRLQLTNVEAGSGTRGRKNPKTKSNWTVKPRDLRCC